jgi:hypothetical protein
MFPSSQFRLTCRCRSIYPPLATSRKTIRSALSQPLNKNANYTFIHQAARVSVYNRPRIPTIAVVVVQQTDSVYDCYGQWMVSEGTRWWKNPRRPNLAPPVAYLLVKVCRGIRMRPVGRLMVRGTMAMGLDADVLSQCRYEGGQPDLLGELREDMPKDVWVKEWLSS